MSANQHTLILHHYEPEWSESMTRMGTPPDQYTENLKHFLLTKGAHIEHVIITRLEEFELDFDFHGDLLQFMDRQQISYECKTFPYAQYQECFRESDWKHLIPSSKASDGDNQVVFIEDWMVELKHSKSITLAGAFEGECVQDAEDALNHLFGDTWTKQNDLVVGTYVPYDAGGHNYGLINDLLDLMSEEDEEGIEVLLAENPLSHGDKVYLELNGHLELLGDLGVEVDRLERDTGREGVLKPILVVRGPQSSMELDDSPSP